MQRTSSDMGEIVAALPPMIERYELKYLISNHLVDKIIDFISPYCAYDAHSTDCDDNFYPVNSLYFDTFNHRFLRLRMWGVENRFNVRLRSYGDGTEGPYFAELKFKSPTCVKKFRTQVEKSEWPFILTEPYKEGVAGGYSEAPVDRERRLFMYVANAYGIEPKMFTSYRRCAFFSLIDDYARVTFDIDLKCRQQTLTASERPYSLEPSEACVNYDLEHVFGDELDHGANTILELKTTAGSVPMWMIELIRKFELKQVGFSKYLSSSIVENHDLGLRYMPPDRQST